jgi:hypothetical protein
MPIEYSNTRAKKSRVWITYSGWLVFVGAVITLQIAFFRGDYIWWLSYPILSPLSDDLVGILTYRTLGALVYGTGFYLALSKAMKALRFSKQDYKAVKVIVWGFLVAIMDVVQRWIVFGLNEAWSLFWNGIRLIVFLGPSFGVIAIGATTYFITKAVLQRRRPNTLP